MQWQHWQQLNRDDFAALDVRSTVVLLPVAAIEQHGPHLPVGTDAMINEGLLAALAQRPWATRVLVLPPQVIGHSLEHQAHAGTLTLPAETLLQSWGALAAGVAAVGLRKLILINTHGGNNSLVHLAALRMRSEHKLLAVRANYFALGSPPGLFAAQEMRDGLHGGEMETSLMLHLYPQWVRRDRLADFGGLPQQLAAGHRCLGVEKPIGFGWLASDLSPQGVCGNAAAADAGRGALLLQHLADGMAMLIEEVAALPLTLLA